ncbi:nucleoside-diphosphatase [Lentinula aff. lateritia]|uniref:Nucleoside-diphosphatase n=1 Tax=Lentinula aff. lateritia TaxID=2804960 RepID=A0ACC1UEF3_9AGAR|nr:nucleoside-diphosphatase [Lentinula aff. lateritia]
MPPPIASDPWLAGRHFGIVIDAGSSGSRLQIYSWKDPSIVSTDWASTFSHTLPKVEKGTKNGEDWSTKVEPGISTFAENPQDIGAYLRPLLSHARDKIPPSLHQDTPLFLLATAGMRLLSSDKQAEILKETCSFLVRHSYFKIDDPSENGPCGSSVLIITGEEEGLFGWIAVNYLMDGFTNKQRHTTYGFLDMGGASTQIAFEPGKDHELDTNDLIDVRLRLLDGDEIHHKVFVTTWLGYGTNQARERYVGMAIEGFEESRSGEADVVPDPCLPKYLELIETPVFVGHASDHIQKTHHLKGTGSFEQCMQKTSTLLNKSKPCPDVPCLMDGVHVPPIDFSVSHFIGVSEYWFSSEHVFGLGGPYNFVEYERAASNFCAREWSDIVHEHEETVKHRPLDGDGEVQGKNGEVVAVGKWGPQVEITRLQMQCFKAAWITNVLHEGIGMPRIVDIGGNTTSESDNVDAKAEQKGLGRPAFQSMDSVGDIAISWTLGKMVLEASKEVPPLHGTVPPINDPQIPEGFPVKPIRPWSSLDGLEDRLTPHLPPSLHRTSLGFSPVLLILYTMFFFVILLIACPLRRQSRAFCLRTLRKVAKRDLNSFALEEGKFLNGNGIISRPPSPTTGPSSGLIKWLRPLRQFIAPKPKRSRTRPSVLTLTGLNSNVHDGPVTPIRGSPVRSYTLPAGMILANSGGSRSSSPIPPSPNNGIVDDTNGGSSSFSPSRNTSHMNLSSMITRSVSRVNVNSGHQISNGFLHD